MNISIKEIDMQIWTNLQLNNKIQINIYINVGIDKDKNNNIDIGIQKLNKLCMQTI